jgi:hypothetical protein
VEHVHAHAGGQAIVGNVEARRGGVSGDEAQFGGRTPCTAVAREGEKRQPAGRSDRGAAVRGEDAAGLALPGARDDERPLPPARRQEHRAADGRRAERCRTANWKHGRYSREACAELRGLRERGLCAPRAPRALRRDRARPGRRTSRSSLRSISSGASYGRIPGTAYVSRASRV